MMDYPKISKELPACAVIINNKEFEKTIKGMVQTKMKRVSSGLKT